jgi:hypothetical protein
LQFAQWKGSASRVNASTAPLGQLVNGRHRAFSAEYCDAALALRGTRCEPGFWNFSISFSARQSLDACRRAPRKEGTAEFLAHRNTSGVIALKKDILAARFAAFRQR